MSANSQPVSRISHGARHIRYSSWHGLVCRHVPDDCSTARSSSLNHVRRAWKPASETTGVLPCKLNGVLHSLNGAARCSASYVVRAGPVCKTAPGNPQVCPSRFRPENVVADPGTRINARTLSLVVPASTCQVARPCLKATTQRVSPVSSDALRASLIPVSTWRQVSDRCGARTFVRPPCEPVGRSRGSLSDRVAADVHPA